MVIPLPSPRLLGFILPSIYFGSLGYAALTVFASLATELLRPRPALCGLCMWYCGGAFAVTWSLIFAFFGEHLRQYGCDGSRLSLFTCHTAAWLGAPVGDTFVEAYRQVTDSSGGWAWSSSLLMFVVPACLWLHVEGARAGLPRPQQAAHLVLGFLGAISASFPVAFAVVYHLQQQQQQQQQRVGAFSLAVDMRWLALPGAVAVISAAVLPYTVRHAPGIFLLALALLHFVLMIPTLFNRMPPAVKAAAAAAASSSASSPSPSSSKGKSPASPQAQLGALNRELSAVMRSLDAGDGSGKRAVRSSRRAGEEGFSWEADRHSGENDDEVKLALLYATFAGAAALQHCHNLAQYSFLPEGALVGAAAAASSLSSSATAAPSWTAVSWARGLVSAGFAKNSCQSSIAWDAVLSGGACLAYMLASGAPASALLNGRSSSSSSSPSPWLPTVKGALPYVAASPVVSVAASFSAYLAVRSWKTAAARWAREEAP